MNDDDLELRLRAESGPREQGYVSTPLPSTLTSPRDRAGAPLLRAALLLPAAAAGIAAVGVVAILLSGSRGPSTGAGSRTSEASPSHATRACMPNDLVITAEPWGGAAGSRGTTVHLTLPEGRNPCLLPTRVHAAVLHARGRMSEIIAGTSHEALAWVQLDPEDAFAVGIAWSNWCGGDVSRPVSLAIRFEGWGDAQPVPRPEDGLDPVPPCMGEGGSTLSVTEVQAAP